MQIFVEVKSYRCTFLFKVDAWAGMIILYSVLQPKYLETKRANYRNIGRGEALYREEVHKR